MPVVGDIALFVALSMAAFAVLFGTRHIDATEHQDGLMLAVATESLVKLIAFLAVGVFVTFWMFDGPAALFTQAMERADTAAILNRDYPFGTIAAMTLLSLFAILLLPRQFHVTVVENHDEREVKRAAWLFPLYLLLINLFVVPIALAGMLTFPAGSVDSDMYVLALPLSAKSELLTLVAFVGGLSAATAMVIVESVALAIMVSNDIVVPLMLKRRERLITEGADVGRMLLTVRRVPIVVILLLAYLYYRSAGAAQLASIGLLSFAAIAQLAPGVLRRPVLEARDRARRHGRHDDRHRDLGLHAAAAELCGCGHRRLHVAERRAVGPHAAAAAGAVRARTAAAGAWRGLEPEPQHHRLYRLLAEPRPGVDRAAAGRPVRPLRPDADLPDASACGAPR